MFCNNVGDGVALRRVVSQTLEKVVVHVVGWLRSVLALAVTHPAVVLRIDIEAIVLQ